MRRDHLTLAAVVASALIPAWGAAFGADGLPAVNDRCPVMPEEEGGDAHSLVYRGKTVRLCCSTCVMKFRADPAAYHARLPQFTPQELAGPEPEGFGPAPVAPPPRSDSGLSLARAADWLGKLPDQAAESRPALTAAVVILMAALIGRFYLRRRGDAPPGRVTRIVAAAAAPPSVAIALLATLSADLAARVSRIDDRIRDALRRNPEYAERVREINNLLDLNWQAILHARKPGAPLPLSGTWYRGNDERNPKLFNNGNYRTVTFRAALVDGDGRPVAHGESVGGRRLAVRFGFERAAHTADGFYTAEAMAKVHLVGRYLRDGGRGGPDPGPPIPLGVVRAGREWRADWTLPPIASDKNGIVEGIVFVVPGAASETAAANPTASAQYAVQYRLTLKDGRIENDSMVWMGATYFTDKSRGSYILEWLSHEPIPELPGPNTDDPALLGLDDYGTDGSRVKP